MTTTKEDYAKLFTAEELKLAKAIVRVADQVAEGILLRHGYKYAAAQGSHSPHRALLAVVEPAMPRINQLTGQENDARFMAYALEWVVS